MDTVPGLQRCGATKAVLFIIKFSPRLLAMLQAELPLHVVSAFELVNLNRYVCCADTTNQTVALGGVTLSTVTQHQCMEATQSRARRAEFPQHV